jgi:hypothetical protein
MPQEKSYGNLPIKVDPAPKYRPRYLHIDNNERKSVDVTPMSVTILPSPDIDPALIVDIKEFEQRVIQKVTPVSEESVNVACIRQKPVPGTTAGEYIVNIMVNKEDKKKFAKVEETVPAGYAAVAMDNRDAIFTFKDQTVKFLWMNLPSERYFTISVQADPKNQAET